MPGTPTSEEQKEIEASIKKTVEGIRTGSLVPEHFKKMTDFSSIEKTIHDPVNHPRHYTNHPSGVECIDITRHMNFNLGNVIKYIWRSGIKSADTPIQDLEKAAWYLNDEIKRRKGEK